MADSLVTKPTLNPALRDFWLTPARNRVLYGGRSSSKSWDAAGFAIFLATQCKIRFLCTRQFQNKISESVYTLLKIQIERFGLRGQFEILNNVIRHKETGSEFIFYGLWRHIDEIKSLESIDICWIEEAHNLTAAQWEILEPTLRGEGSQFWIIFNPRLMTDFVYRKFVRDTPSKTIKGKIQGVIGATIKRHINFDENPFLSNTILEVINRKRDEDEEDFRHIYGGEPREDGDSVVIKRSWIMAAIDAHKVLGIAPQGENRVGFDVADDGNDKCASVAFHGWVAIEIDEWAAKEDELLKSAGRVHGVARRLKANIDYDSIGVGAFAGAHFKKLNGEHKTSLQYHKFNAGDAVLNPNIRIDPEDPKSPKNIDYYANLKAQAWWDLARRFRNTFNAVTKGETFDAGDMVSISSDCDHLDTLVDELCTPLRDFDNAGRVKVESKKDLAKRDVPSPNIADAFVIGTAKRQAAPQVQMLLSKRLRQ